MGCPMTEDVPLTNAEIERFCNKGCSVDCEKFLDEYLKKIKRVKLTNVEVSK